jgi:hypothetical protein
MICCLCGAYIVPGDYVVRVNHLRVVADPAGNDALVSVPFEDGTFRKIAHSVCPALYGAPLALLGANGRFDV